MIISRRVRRYLLLPPGWVALGALLLLGYWQIRYWERQLRPMRVVQLTMPARRLKPETLQLLGKEYAAAYMTPAELDAFRPWYSTEVKGRKIPDFFNIAATESALRKIIADTGHVNGVRIRFLPGATYANLIEVLDIMNRIDQKKYWLDIRHRPVTLYAITVRQKRIRTSGASSYLGCCTCGPYMPKPLTKAAWRMKFQGLWTKPWRLPTILLALTGAQSLWLLFSRRFVLTSTH